MTFNLWTFLIEVVNFVVLAYILHWLLYRPLRAAIDKRRGAIAQEKAEAEKARADAIALQQQLQAQLADMEQQRQAAVQAARAQAEAERHRLIAEGEKAVERRQQEVHLALERQREDALRSLQAEVRAAAADLAERLLKEAAGTNLQGQLAKRLVETLRQLPQDQRAQVRREWNEGDGAVVEVAAALDPASLAEINEAVNDVVGRKVTLGVETRPALLAGARLRIGGHLWDASLAGQLDSVRSGSAEKQPHA